MLLMLEKPRGLRSLLAENLNVVKTIKENVSPEIGPKSLGTFEKQAPGIPGSLFWSPETKRHEPKINTAEKLVDVFVKLRQRGKKDQPPKLYVVTMLIFMIKRTI